eukprot:2771560-Lingulodinium_polyedra.AAC.1
MPGPAFFRLRTAESLPCSVPEVRSADAAACTAPASHRSMMHRSLESPGGHCTARGCGAAASLATAGTLPALWARARGA